MPTLAQYDPEYAEPTRPGGETSAEESQRVDRRLGLSIAQIVDGIRASDYALFDAVFRAYHGALVHFADCYLRSPDAAQDVVSDVFLALWQERSAWRITHTVESYLFGAVRNRALNRARGARRERRWAGEFLREDVPPAMSAPPLSPEASAVASDQNARIWHAIDALPERSRLVLVLRWQRQMSFDEIAEVMDLTLWAVQQIHSRAIRALRKTLPKMLR